MIKVNFNYDIENMYDFLSENATEYFDNIVYDDEEKTISCYVGNLLFIKFADPSVVSSSRSYITINTNGLSEAKALNSTTTLRWDIGYKCEGGIALSFAKIGDVHCVWSVIITKDINGKTALITDTINWAATSYNTTFANNYYLNIDSDDYSKLNVNSDKVTKANVTGIVPAPIGGSEGSYCGNVFIMAYKQYDYEGVIQIGSDKYLSNGSMLIKD